MTIRLPRLFTAANMPDTLAAAFDMATCEAERVQIDASELGFIDPFGLSLLAAACERVGQARRVVEVTAINPVFSGYLERMDLFRQPWIIYPSAAASGRRDRRGSLVELRRLTAVRDVDRVAFDLGSVLLGQVPGLNEAAARDEMTGFNEWDRMHEPLCHVFAELLQNSLTHARHHGYAHSNVWVSAQYYQRSDKIHVGIADTGCGFLASLRNHPQLRAKKHEPAIQLALQPRVSCNRDVGLAGMGEESINAGIGLTTTYRIARDADGRIAIVSGDACVWAEDNRNIAAVGIAYPYWQGAALCLELPRANLTRLRLRNLMPPRDIGRQPPPIRFG